MTATLEAIKTRRDILVAESAAQRALLAEAWRGLQKPAAAGQRAAQALSSPWLWGGAALVALKLRKNNILRMPLMIWKGWRMVRWVRAVVG